MLQIQHIRKEYTTGKLVQKALDDVSLNLRDNEFVAILGPSGSGKTTLLNIIGGLDRYDSGDLIINGISTKQYKDRDWDSYRNHTIGFVFQSYNLIPHQTVLANVELALTISGIGKAERRERAVKALEEVGLGEQLHKKPNQMSGGQMQRVAIARALVNDPDILLADEPTGALDSDTSVQVMDLLRDVAKDRLVVMVTHNPELAEQYATRIVRLRDGKIRADSDPYVIEEGTQEPPQHKNMGKSSMSFLTALSLSFNNLRTKKARTLLTSFAGSIGIIGIALILSLSTGVNDYIQTVEEETLSEYPLQIQSTGFDFSSMMASGTDGDKEKGEEGDVHVIDMISSMFSTMDSNDLESLKSYLDSGESGIEQYTNAIEYSYNVVPQIFKQEEDGDIRQVNPDTSFSALGLGSSSGSNSMMSAMMSTDVFYEMPEDTDLYEGQYDVKAGRWPENYNECVLVLTSGGGISDFMLYTMGLRDPLELDEMIQQFIDEEDVDTPADISDYSYDDILGITFKLVNSSDCYVYDREYEIWRDKTDDKEYMENLVENGEDLTIVGIVQPSEDANGLMLNAGIGYPASLTRHVAETAGDSEIVQKQLENKDINVFTGEKFGESGDQAGFDTDSLFSIDADKLQEAFSFNSDGLTDGLDGAFDMSNLVSADGSTMDLSSMIDLSGIQLDLPEMPSLSLSDMMDSIEITASADDVNTLVSGLLEGYRQYASEHPEADYSNLGQDLLTYLQTSEARSILTDNILAIVEANGGITVSTDQIRAMFTEILEGYQQYAQANGYTDPDLFDDYLLEYLQTPDAQAILNRWGDELIQANSDFTVTDEQLSKLASDIASGYQGYAVANGLPDPSRMGEHFLNYLGTDDAKQKLSSGIAGMVDTGNLEEQISSSIQGYVGSMMSSFTGEMAQNLETQITAAMTQVMAQISTGLEDTMGTAMTQLGQNLEDAMSIDSNMFAAAFTMNMDADDLTELMMSMSTAENATYENNLRTLGYVDFDVPSEIDIYPIDFESKESVVNILDNYNSRMEAEGKDEQVITYTDVVGTLMSSVTDIIDIISYVLIAFVAISLVVSSIMIGVITYISVLERKKEIGILRAIGASKGNISQVFNAETFIIGLCAGLIGIGLSLLLLIPGNALIHHLAGTDDVSAVLPVIPAVILIILSVVLTLIGGIIPSRKAAKSDPVTALRTE
ncbi:ABC transporter ATP-binding protein/permease [Mediterraneibacter glycyrrhizinilyticus]|uniref:ABC transporter ATP-binding protein/permease n=1 Tax=Mediterraneibacter glycyrrhizinilyticus TaxID=342942 RepID=UPI0019604C50|nr:ABC transporter ATP-binding protein/permease [Mediterraneibacter glycyrrhizinilyticus]MBM6750429.1 ABC transporter ATP-binding protein/permease [Mediterraneibacter glycyrrhizinilyticus]